MLSLDVSASTATWNAVTTDTNGNPVTPGGYQIGIGIASRSYTTVLDAGIATSATITLPSQQTAYIAVRAYPQATDTAHVTSAWSTEVVIPYQSTTSTTNFGETTVFTSPDNGNADLLLAQEETLSQGGTLQSLSFYVSNAAGKLRLGVYDAGGPNGGPGVLIAQTNEITPVANSWNTASVVTPIQLAAGNYWLAYLVSDNGLGFWKASGTIPSWYRSFCYGFMPAHFSDASACAGTPLSNTLWHWSFYATVNHPISSPSGLSVTP